MTIISNNINPINNLDVSAAYTSLNYDDTFFSKSALGIWYEVQPTSNTISVSSSTKNEEDFNVITGSGIFDCWDNPEEDVYNFEDGEAL